MRSLSIYYSNRPDQFLIVKEARELCDEMGTLFVDICIDNDTALEKRFGENTPVVLVGPYRLNHPFTRNELEVAIKATIKKDLENPGGEEDTKRFQMTTTEKFALWFSKSYAWVIAAILIIFLGFTMVPPMLAAGNFDKMANVGYKFYSLLCHQLAFRSFFVRGEQIAYPRELANVGSLVTYEEITGKSAEDIKFARHLVGNEIMGYKIALCQRDLAIYAGLAIFGLVFQATGKKIKHLPWYFWVIFAVLPIAIDGSSQLPGLAGGWPAWLPVRESTPFLRTLTGALFGVGTAWYVFPMMEESISETRFSLERKMNISKRFTTEQ